ncbi:MAG: putative transketolase N-terminal section [Candidatus Thorarchaeota archaeon]|nr:MAG: putative transketolase N-terminal section [Candidatus Thorarchaeota archaeon]
MNIEELRKQSIHNRIDIIEMIAEAGSGHPGGSLSCIDILTVLYFDKMNIDPANPEWSDRDRFVLSKGHAAPALYACLAEKGYFSKRTLLTLRKLKSILQGHPDCVRTPGVDTSSGSLGQGLSIANGMALAAKIDGKDYLVYAVLGDGEIQEGQIWEAAMTAAHHCLGNLIAFVDWNGLQIDGRCDELKSICPIEDKFSAFGWHVISIDGHDFEQIIRAIEEAQGVTDKPTMIVAKTTKGKGVSFMEDNIGFHGKAPNEEETKQALQELQESLEQEGGTDE